MLALFCCRQCQYFCFDFVVESMAVFGGLLDFVLADWDCLLRKQRWAAQLVSKDHAKLCSEIQSFKCLASFCGRT